MVDFVNISPSLYFSLIHFGVSILAGFYYLPVNNAMFLHQMDFVRSFHSS